MGAQKIDDTKGGMRHPERHLLDYIRSQTYPAECWRRRWRCPSPSWSSLTKQTCLWSPWCWSACYVSHTQPDRISKSSSTSDHQKMGTIQNKLVPLIIECFLLQYFTVFSTFWLQIHFSRTTTFSSKSLSPTSITCYTRNPLLAGNLSHHTIQEMKVRASSS